MGVWQMTMHIILNLRHNVPRQCRLFHAGTLPTRFSVHYEINKEIRFLLFFSFSARSKAGGRCRSAVLNLSEWLCLCSVVNLAFKRQSISSMNRLQSDHSMHPVPFFFAWICWRSRHDFRQFFWDLLLSASASAAAGSGNGRASFFFFFTVDRTTNRVQTPSLPYESSFVCPRRANFWDDP